MLFPKKYFIILMICISTSLCSLTLKYDNPNQTTSNLGSPNLSEGSEDAEDPQLATSESGKYVYVIWTRTVGAGVVIQTVYSSDFGNTWKEPSQTTSDLGSPNLSDSGGDAESPQISTDDSGKYVYAIWARNNGSNRVIQTVFSSDYGDTWQEPSQTPLGTSAPDLSVSGRNSLRPYIVSDSSGKYVYAIWYRDSLPNDQVQTAFSDDYGNTWQNPSQTPPGTSSPNLSVSGHNAGLPEIAISKSGQAVWMRYDGSDQIVQTAYSNDFGRTWQNPSQTPPGTSSPNLSEAGENGSFPVVVTDISGKYVFASWARNSGFYAFTQVAFSNDFGKTWQNPSQTPSDQGSPNLSQSNLVTRDIAITADSSGRYIFIIWLALDGADDIIQTAFSSDFGTTWLYPSQVPPNAVSPNISEVSTFADDPQITVDDSGRFIYAAWTISDGSNDIIQTAYSKDFGNTWENPDQTPPNTTSPNLSIAGNDASSVQIQTDSTGNQVYVVWVRYNNFNDIVQTAKAARSYFPVRGLSLSRP